MLLPIDRDARGNVDLAAHYIRVLETLKTTHERLSGREDRTAGDRPVKPNLTRFFPVRETAGEPKTKGEAKMNRKIHPLIVAAILAVYFVVGVPIVARYLENRTAMREAEVAFLISERKTNEATERMRTRKEAMRQVLSTFYLSESEAEALRGTISRASDRTITPFHILRMIEVESGGDPKAVGAKGERGLLQVMPWIARPHLARLGRSDLFDPETNVLVGTMELRRLLVLFDGDLSLALAAYNGGPTRALRYASRVTGAARADNCSTWNEREGVDR